MKKAPKSELTKIQITNKKSFKTSTKILSFIALTSISSAVFLRILVKAPLILSWLFLGRKKQV